MPETGESGGVSEVEDELSNVMEQPRYETLASALLPCQVPEFIGRKRRRERMIPESLGNLIARQVG